MINKKKQFIKLPEYPGGKEQLIKYLRENLQYPELARINNIEGIVHLTAEIDNDGNVINAMIDKSLGYGCDEEAIRLVSSLNFGRVTNKGRRVTITKKFRIEFQLPKNISVQYNLKPEIKVKSSEEFIKGNSFTYQIQFPKD